MDVVAAWTVETASVSLVRAVMTARWTAGGVMERGAVARQVKPLVVMTLTFKHASALQLPSVASRAGVRPASTPLVISVAAPALNVEMNSVMEGSNV